MKQTRIIIAGGGPVGVVSALACAQQGYAVTLLEADNQIDDNPRAATTHPSTLEMIARVGLIDQFIQEGLVARYFQFWDKPARVISRRLRDRRRRRPQHDPQSPRYRL
jgi:3-(3-hydroxy-phenyl)propionate hydroxylase